MSVPIVTLFRPSRWQSENGGRELVLESLTQRYQAGEARVQLVGCLFEDEDACRLYLRGRVRERLEEADASELLREYVQDLGDTGFEVQGLEGQVSTPPRARDWEIGEAIAEAVLEDRYSCRFPWPTALDKRTPKASLPGPDLVGFHRLSQGDRFAFGEVKSSSHNQHPPTVVTMPGDGLRDQLIRLLTSKPHRDQLVGWLLAKSKGSTHASAFDDSLARYIASPSSAWIIGVLVRGGIEPDENDLSATLDAISAIETTYEVTLLAFHLPFAMTAWTDVVYQTGGTE